MGEILEKTKRGLDWLQHGYLLVQLGSAIGVGKALQAVLVTYTHIPRIWVTPLWLLASAAMMALLVSLGNLLRRRQEQIRSPQAQATSPLIPAPVVPNFNADAHFRTSYQSELTADVEKNIRLAAAQNQPNDREGFMAKLIGIGLVSYFHDQAWAYIFKSQLLMLQELNRRGGLMPRADAKLFYDSARMEYPQVYQDYSFDQWLGFVKTQQHIIEHPSAMIEITVRGRDFLKYLTHWGRAFDLRKW